MKKLLDPKWVLLFNTLPIAILISSYLTKYNIIKSLLKPETIDLWQYLGLILLLSGIIVFVYGLVQFFKETKLNIWYAILSFIFYCIFMHYSMDCEYKLIPWSVPRWMVERNGFINIATFLMPSLLHAMIIATVHFTPDNKSHKSSNNFGYAILIPIGTFLTAMIIIPLRKVVGYNFHEHLLIVIIITGITLFLFFLLRATYIMVNKKSEKWNNNKLAWQIPITIILPLIGLSVNNGGIIEDFGPGSSEGVFGDFSNYWYYVLAIANGTLLCLHNIKHHLMRLALFAAKWITFSYTLYFFIVFLPLLPLAVPLIILMGLGLLMLTPSALFIIHTNSLSKDYHFLKSYFSKSLLCPIAIASVFVIPFIITINYLGDKKNLNNSLEYLYAPDYANPAEIDLPAIKNTITIIKENKKRSGGMIFASKKPFLSSYYNWLVLENLTLSDAKINKLERVFLDVPKKEGRSEFIQNSQVEIKTISSNSTYDEAHKAWNSWIDLEIENHGSRQGEYSTIIDLPTGAWISDYYLNVFGKKEMGMLSEKRTALWVYSNIRNRRKDPGILYYLTGNKVSFRVFPFAKNEIRKTGIEILHRDPIKINIDNHELELGEYSIDQDSNNEYKNALFISGENKKELEKVNRIPYFHFLIDGRLENKLRNYAAHINQLSETYPMMINHAKLSLINSSVMTKAFKPDWISSFSEFKYGGGFFLEQGIKTALYHSYKNQDATYPVFVVLSDSLETAIIEKDFGDWEFSFPETDKFYSLNNDAYLMAHSLIDSPLKVIESDAKIPQNLSVRAYPTNGSELKYIADNEEASLIPKDRMDLSEKSPETKQWEDGLALQAEWTRQILHPESSNESWLSLIRKSFETKIMSPVTSYLVVENDAQRAMLKKKQDQVLNSNKLLDLSDDATRMSEPNLLFVLAAFMIFFLYRNRYKWEILKS
jgi:hypothetical protein